MRKILIISLIIAIFLVVGCSVKEEKSCFEKEVKYIEMEKVTTTVCEEVKYQLNIIESKIDPIPNKAKREYDVGTVIVSLLNQDEIGGDFIVSIECVTSALGNLKETRTINLQPGSVERVTIRCDGRNAGTILSITDPIVESAPKTKDCKEITEEKPVEKIRYETVCE